MPVVGSLLVLPDNETYIVFWCVTNVFAEYVIPELQKPSQLKFDIIYNYSFIVYVLVGVTVGVTVGVGVGDTGTTSMSSATIVPPSKNVTYPVLSAASLTTFVVISL